MSPLDIARLCIGSQASTINDINSDPTLRSHIAGLFVKDCIDAYNRCVKAYNGQRFASLLFTPSDEFPPLREEGLASGTPPQPGDTFMISINGHWQRGFIERVEGGRIFTIEFNTDEVRDKYEVWRKPDGWPIEKISYLLRPKVSLIDL